MTNFDAETLHEFRDVRKVAIRTEKHPKSAVVIWVVVADDEVLVRSWRGAEGRWYRDLAAGGPTTLEYAGRRLEVQVSPADDHPAVTRVSGESLRKYQRNNHVQEMVRFGEPEEIAAAVVWLCSPAASFMVGHAMTVDGGLLAG